MAARAFYGRAPGRTAPTWSRIAPTSVVRGLIWFDGRAVKTSMSRSSSISPNRVWTRPARPPSRSVWEQNRGWWVASTKDDGRFNFGLRRRDLRRRQMVGETVFDHVGSRSWRIRKHGPIQRGGSFAAECGNARPRVRAHAGPVRRILGRGAGFRQRVCAANNALCVTDYTGLMGTTGLAHLPATG